MNADISELVTLLDTEKTSTEISPERVRGVLLLMKANISSYVHMTGIGIFATFISVFIFMLSILGKNPSTD